MWVYLVFKLILESGFLQKEEERSKEKGKGKPRNIDYFMEELKHEQEMRERRNQEREQWHDGRQTATSTVRHD